MKHLRFLVTNFGDLQSTIDSTLGEALITYQPFQEIRAGVTLRSPELARRLENF